MRSIIDDLWGNVAALATAKTLAWCSGSAARCSRDDGLSETKARLPYLDGRVRGGEARQPSFDLSDISLGGLNLLDGRRRLNVGARVRTRASL